MWAIIISRRGASTTVVDFGEDQVNCKVPGSPLRMTSTHFLLKMCYCFNQQAVVIRQASAREPKTLTTREQNRVRRRFGNLDPNTGGSKRNHCLLHRLVRRNIRITIGDRWRNCDRFWRILEDDLGRTSDLGKVYLPHTVLNRHAYSVFVI